MIFFNKRNLIVAALAIQALWMPAVDAKMAQGFVVALGAGANLQGGTIDAKKADKPATGAPKYNAWAAKEGADLKLNGFAGDLALGYRWVCGHVFVQPTLGAQYTSSSTTQTFLQDPKNPKSDVGATLAYSNPMAVQGMLKVGYNFGAFSPFMTLNAQGDYRTLVLDVMFKGSEKKHERDGTFGFSFGVGGGVEMAITKNVHVAVSYNCQLQGKQKTFSPALLINGTNYVTQIDVKPNAAHVAKVGVAYVF